MPTNITVATKSAYEMHVATRDSQKSLVQAYRQQLEEGSLEDAVGMFQDISRRNAAFKRAFGKRTFALIRDSGNQDLMASFLQTFNASDTDHAYVLSAAKLDQMQHAASFRTCIALRTRRMFSEGIRSCPEWVLQNKGSAYRFADRVRIRRPLRYDLEPGAVPTLRPGTVIKPRNAGGSSGVYLVFSETSVFDVRQTEYFSGAPELARRIAEDVATRRVVTPSWFLEELVLNSRNPSSASYDWKCYSFYGKVLLIGVVQRYPDHREVWFGPDGKELDRGFNRSEGSLSGLKFDPSVLEAAATISLKIPAPFIRIDFLDSDNGFVLGEFTARPGTFHMFSKEMDRRLGEAYIQAEAKLQKDLLRGKPFTTYKLFLSGGKIKKKKPKPLLKRIIPGLRWRARKLLGLS